MGTFVFDGLAPLLCGAALHEMPCCPRRTEGARVPRRSFRPGSCSLAGGVLERLGVGVRSQVGNNTSIFITIINTMTMTIAITIIIAISITISITNTITMTITSTSTITITIITITIRITISYC